MPLTRDELLALLSVLAGASGQDAADLEACSLDELTLLARAYREAATGREATALEQLEAWLVEAAKVAGPAATILSALTSAVGLVRAP